LLLWLLFVSGTFGATEEVKANYRHLLRQNHGTRFRGLYNTWDELQIILKSFIWSDRSFEEQATAFWEAYQREE